MMDVNITELRDNPKYILYYIHWTRLITTGILPFVYLLVRLSQPAAALEPGCEEMWRK